MVTGDPVTAGEIQDYLVGGLGGRQLLYDEAGEEIRAALYLQHDTGLVIAREPDTHPELVLGRFRVTVEKIEDEP